ncbi:tetratricopeptide repeat protein [Candidatus Sumerlaeota bacterium]|nr:tetratricopeptide repeat protein [Candidatus Sumerlaeota bacterium]
MNPLRKSDSLPDAAARRWIIVIISAGLAALILIAFEPVRHNSFIAFDDNSYITANPHVQSGFTVDSIVWAFTSGHSSNWHPLTWLSHMLDAQLFGMNPLWHHWHNLALHLIATILLFLILHKMTGAVWPCAFTAMVFGIHPLRVESVAWAAERKDVLSGVFWMLTLAAYYYYVKAGGVVRYLLVALCLALGLMAKPMLVSLPLILLLLDFWPLGRVREFIVDADEKANAMPLRKLIVEKIPLLLLVLISCVVTYLVQRHGKSTSPDLAMVYRVLNAMNSCTAYLGKVVYPVDLALLYPQPQHLPLWKPAASAVILVLITAFVIMQRFRRPYLAAGWFWYLIALAPVIGIVQVGAQSMADRYTYLPAIGLSMMAAWGAAELSARWRRQQAILSILCAGIALAMIMGTRAQLRYWTDSVTLFEHALAVTEDNYPMHHSLGFALAEQGRLDEAAKHFVQALKIWPEAKLDVELANLMIKQKKYDDALDLLRDVIKEEPDNSLAYYNMGIAYQLQEKFGAAAAAYEQAVRLDRNNAKAFNNLGVLKAQQGLIDEAAECFRECLRGAPYNATAHRQLASMLLMQGRNDEAAAQCRAALKINPRDAEANFFLAYALRMTGKPDEAAEYARKAVELARAAGDDELAREFEQRMQFD